MQADPSAGARGFTLLEVLVAFIIAALALAALFEGGLGGLRASTVSSRYQEAVARAQSHLATAAVEGSLVASDRQGDEGGGFHWHVRVTETAVGAPQPGARPGAGAALFAVSVAESWSEDGHSRIVQLDTQRVGAAAAPPP
jgi:general secretion pathway protein I